MSEARSGRLASFIINKELKSRKLLLGNSFGIPMNLGFIRTIYGCQYYRQRVLS
jgi:hypothetical protein